MDFFVSGQQASPQKGDLLISEPYLPDPNFERTVVYLCAHDENGTFGFVLNRMAHVKLGAVIDEVSSDQSDMFIGGPVEKDTLHFLHRDPELAATSLQVASDIYWGGDFSLLVDRIELRNLPSKDIRFFLGYSGWAQGQLDAEIKANSWIVLKKATPEMIFDWDNQQLWKVCLKAMGGKYRLMSNYPKDPRMN